MKPTVKDKKLAIDDVAMNKIPLGDDVPIVRNRSARILSFSFHLIKL
jgi:hypothetical protein